MRVGLRLTVNVQFCVGFRVKVRMKLMLKIRVQDSDQCEYRVSVRFKYVFRSE